MKISRQALKSFNLGILSSFNENVNKAKGLPTLIESMLLSIVKNDKYGMLNRNIAHSDIEEWLKYNKFELSDDLIRHAKREGLKL